jgi:excisionase family DNA binding protein
MTLNEAAAILGVTPDTLRQQLANGKLRGRKIGPLWTVTRREVERYRRESRRVRSITDAD